MSSSTATASCSGCCRDDGRPRRGAGASQDGRKHDLANDARGRHVLIRLVVIARCRHHRQVQPGKDKQPLAAIAGGAPTRLQPRPVPARRVGVSKPNAPEIPVVTIFAHFIDRHRPATCSARSTPTATRHGLQTPPRNINWPILARSAATSGCRKRRSVRDRGQRTSRSGHAERIEQDFTRVIAQRSVAYPWQ